MNAEIIAVGSELLLGQIANTNAQYLSTQLASIGINVYYHTVVGDNEKRLRSAIETAKDRVDLIIFTGGLGPTEDDLTKETVSDSIGKSLQIHEESLQKILEYFTRSHKQFPDNNRKQALVIQDSEVFLNRFGMAPGMAITVDKKQYVLLPGPPSEMKPMVRDQLVPFLVSKSVKKEKIQSTVLRFFGIGESFIEEKLQDMFSSGQNPTLAPLAGDDEVTVRITGKHEDEATLSAMLLEAEKEVLSRIGSHFYAKGDTSLAKEVFTVLESNNFTVASAESFTGGWFLKEMTSFKGASQVVKGGFVTYTNEMKHLLLDIPKEVLSNDGAVSEKCARLMAESARKKTGASFGISFTGNAGPTESEGKPVGMVYIGISPFYGETKVFPLNLNGNRDRVRHRGVLAACHLLLKEFLLVQHD